MNNNQELLIIQNKATETFQHINCCQTMITVFSAEYGQKLSSDLFKGASLLGGGLCGHKNSVCGALLGTILSLGISTLSKEQGVLAGQQFLKWAEERFGSINCCDLIANYTEANRKTECIRIVKECCRWLFEYHKSNK